MFAKHFLKFNAISFNSRGKILSTVHCKEKREAELSICCYSYTSYTMPIMHRGEDRETPLQAFSPVQYSLRLYSTQSMDSNNYGQAT